MSWVDQKDVYEAFARKFNPNVILTTKDGWFWRALAWLVTIVTLGGVRRQTFLTEYATTLGPVQAYPRAWEKIEMPVLVHECRHVTQVEWFGWMVPILGWLPRLRAWVGLPLFAFVYLLLPLPIGLAWCRFWFELDADRTSWRWMQQNGYSAAVISIQAGWFALRVCGRDYGWAWPRQAGVARFIEEVVSVEKGG